MSNTTTNRMRKEVLQGQYSEITSIIKKKKGRDQFWSELEVLIRCGMPEMGKGRWKWLDEMYPK